MIKRCTSWAELEQRRTSRAAQQGRIDRGRGVVALRAAPGEQERDHGKSAGMHRKTRAEGMTEMAETDVVAAQSDLAFVDCKQDADRKLPERVLYASAKEENVRAAEAVVGIAGEHCGSIDVGAADGGRKVERDDTAATRKRFRYEGSQGDGAFKLLRSGDDGAWARRMRFRFRGSCDGNVGTGAGAVVGTVVLETGSTIRRV